MLDSAVEQCGCFQTSRRWTQGPEVPLTSLFFRAGVQEAMCSSFCLAIKQVTLFSSFKYFGLSHPHDVVFVVLHVLGKLGVVSSSPPLFMCPAAWLLCSLTSSEGSLGTEALRLLNLGKTILAANLLLVTEACEQFEPYICLSICSVHLC